MCGLIKDDSLDRLSVKEQLDLEIQNSILIGTQQAGVDFELVRLTICVSGGWREVDKTEEQEMLKGKSRKIRSVPTRPLHAVLDEPV